MAVTYGFFNSVSGDRTYDADQMSEYFDGLVSNGVYESVGGALRVSAAEGMTVNVAPGRGLINSKWIKNDAVLNLELTEANIQLPRYTAIVFRLDNTNRLIEITTKDGSPSASPERPEMQQDDVIFELCLAYVLVPAGASSVSASNIYDMRGSELCPWVTGVVKQVDTAELFNQYAAWMQERTAAFDSWFDTLTSQLQVNTYLARYVKTVSLASEDSRAIPLDMSGYTFEDSDIIFVFINGLKATESVDYTLANSVITVNLASVSGVTNTVEIWALKSKIGDAPSGGGSGNLITANSSIGGSAEVG